MRNPFAVATLAVVLATGLAGCGGGGGTSTVDTSNAPAPLPVGAGPQPTPPTSTTTVEPAALAWTQPAGLPASAWHWTASNPSGSVMVATAIPGGVYLSRDQGATWQAQAALPQGATIWISADLSDDGQVIVAVALNGGMYRSTDGGANWSRIDTAFNASENLDYESVSVSADGQRIVAAIMGGSIYASSDGTAATPTFTPATLADGSALSSFWRALDSDASGMHVVAASHNGDVWTSDDGGATFAPLPVSVAGTAVTDGWYRLALSRDGNTLALVGSEEFGIGQPVGSRSTGLYVGRRSAGGWSFARASTVSGAYTRVTIAANAPVIAATLSGTGGGALISTDDGATFATLPVPSTDTMWRSIALTGDGMHALLAAGTFFGDPGHLYLSSGTLAR